MSDAPDEYELRYMDGEHALARVRQRQPRWFAAVLVGVVALLIASMAPLLLWMSRTPAGRTQAIFFSVVYALEFLSLFPALIVGHITRAVVTPTHLRVHQGLRRADVPLAAITALSVEPVRRWRSHGTLRGRLLRREHAFVNFSARRCLRVEWRSASGRTKTLFAQLDEAPALCALLASLTAGRTGVRVEADAAADAEAAEVEAVELAAAARTKGS